MSDLAVGCTAPVYVDIGARVTKLCPFKDEVDYGTIVISYRVEQKTLELHTLRALLDEYAAQKLTHEDFTDALSGRLTSLLGNLVHVKSEWKTAGLCVEVSTAPLS